MQLKASLAILSAYYIAQASAELYVLYKGQSVTIDTVGESIGVGNLSNAVKKAIRGANVEKPLDLLCFDKLVRVEARAMNTDLIPALSVAKRIELLEKMKSFKLPTDNKPSRLRDLRNALLASLAKESPSALGTELRNECYQAVQELSAMHPAVALFNENFTFDAKTLRELFGVSWLSDGNDESVESYVNDALVDAILSGRNLHEIVQGLELDIAPEQITNNARIAQFLETYHNEYTDSQEVADYAGSGESTEPLVEEGGSLVEEIVESKQKLPFRKSSKSATTEQWSTASKSHRIPYLESLNQDKFKPVKTLLDSSESSTSTNAFDEWVIEKVPEKANNLKMSKHSKSKPSSKSTDRADKWSNVKRSLEREFSGKRRQSSKKSAKSNKSQVINEDDFYGEMSASWDSEEFDKSLEEEVKPEKTVSRHHSKKGHRSDSKKWSRGSQSKHTKSSESF